MSSDYKEGARGLFLQKKELGGWIPSLCLRAPRHKTQAEVHQSHRTNHPKAVKQRDSIMAIPTVNLTTNKPQVVSYKS